MTNMHPILKVGDIAPLFSLEADNGQTVSLESALKDQPLLLYFYPKDNTPGCTLQARGLAASFAQFQQKNIRLLGISKDTPASHKKFKEKHHLPFLLLSDPDAQVCTQFGVYVDKSLFGKHYKGIARHTFFIDQTGKIRAIWRKVSVRTHAQDVLEQINKIL